MVDQPQSHGSAKWAKLTDLDQAGALMNGGITVGHKWQNGADGFSQFFPVQYDGEQHITTLAPISTAARLETGGFMVALA